MERKRQVQHYLAQPKSINLVSIGDDVISQYISLNERDKKTSEI